MLKGRKKILVRGNSPQSWPWKQSGTTIVAAVMIHKIVNHWRSALQIYFDLNCFPLQETITLCYHYNSRVTGVYMSYMFNRNAGWKTSSIEWLFEQV